MISQLSMSDNFHKASLMVMESFILTTMIFYKELLFMEGAKAKADL